MWGPFGGYRAAIFLRAMAASEPAAAAGELHVHVPRHRQAGAGGDRRRVATGRQARPCAHRGDDAGRRADHGRDRLVRRRGMAGFEHDVATMPTVPPAAALRGFQDLADNYSEWYPLWRNVEGRPLLWDPGLGPPIYQIWLRLLQPLPAADPVARGRAPPDVARPDHVERGAAAAWLAAEVSRAEPRPDRAIPPRRPAGGVALRRRRRADRRQRPRRLPRPHLVAVGDAARERYLSPHLSSESPSWMKPQRSTEASVPLCDLCGQAAARSCS